MKQKKISGQSKSRNKSSSGDKNKPQLTPKEGYNTGSHTPSSLRNVGPGYDDTGKGAYARSKEVIISNPKNKKQSKSANRS